MIVMMKEMSTRTRKPETYFRCQSVSVPTRLFSAFTFISRKGIVWQIALEHIIKMSYFSIPE